MALSPQKIDCSVYSGDAQASPGMALLDPVCKTEQHHVLKSHHLAVGPGGQDSLEDCPVLPLQLGKFPPSKINTAGLIVQPMRKSTDQEQLVLPGFTCG